MRFVSFRVGGKGAVHVGVSWSEEGKVVDVTAASGIKSMRQLLRLEYDGPSDADEERQLAAYRAALEAGEGGEHALSRDALTLVAPISDPEKVVCVGMNYLKHCTEQGFPVPTSPLLFSKFPSCICSDGDAVVHPKETRKLDFEVELVIVVGKSGRRIRKEDAMAHVAGFTVAHDVSARDWQLEENGGQWLLGKAMDGFCPLGPEILQTKDLGDPHALRLWCKLNGETVQDGNTSDLVFKTEDVIEYASRFFTLSAGDLILTGTPSGVGCFRKPPLWLKPGDVVEVGVEKIGTLTNKIIADPAAADGDEAGEEGAAATGGGGSA